jgi:hypothetical protein
MDRIGWCPVEVLGMALGNPGFSPGSVDVSSGRPISMPISDLI